MRIYETWSAIGQNEVNSMAWLGPGFHPSYSGVQTKISVLFCQWFTCSFSRFLPLWLRWVSWPFPAELRSPLLLGLHLCPTFSSGKSIPRSVTSSDCRIRVVPCIWDLSIWLGSEVRFTGWGCEAGFPGPSRDHGEHIPWRSLGCGTGGLVLWAPDPKPQRVLQAGSWLWQVDFPKAMGE